MIMIIAFRQWWKDKISAKQTMLIIIDLLSKKISSTKQIVVIVQGLFVFVSNTPSNYVGGNPITKNTCVNNFSFETKMKDWKTTGEIKE